MAEQLIKLHKDENLLHIAEYKGMKGFIHLEKDGLIYEKTKGEIDHTISIKNINKIEYKEEADEFFFIIYTTEQKYQYRMSKDNEEKQKDEELYFALSGLLLKESEINNFIKSSVIFENIECRKMFNNFIIARILEGEGRLRHNEKFKGALYGRYCPDFTNHYYGILAVTNQRVFFFDRIEQKIALELNEINGLKIIKSFDDYTDSYGRTHYNLEFNQSDFIVDVLTKREVKIEMFHKILEPNKPLDWSF